MATEALAITTPVAAAASVPFSSTSTNALCTTAEITRSREPFIPEKSASPRGERRRHSERGKGVLELAFRRELEPRQDHLDAALEQRIQPAIELCERKRGFEQAEPV